MTAITGLGEIDMIVRLSGLPSWSEVAARAVTVPFEGLEIRVVDRQTLIDGKRRRATPLDRDDADKLEELDG